MRLSCLFGIISNVSNGVSTAHVFLPQFASRLEQKAGMEIRAAFVKAHNVGVPVFNEPRFCDCEAK